MGYGLLLTYGVFRGNPCPPSWWTENVWDTGGYGLSRVWVTGGSTVHYFLNIPDAVPASKTHPRDVITRWAGPNPNLGDLTF